jgi:hypothetical protein
MQASRLGVSTLHVVSGVRRHARRFYRSRFTPIEDWRRVQPRIPSRADAIKALVQIGLETERQRLEQPGKP